MALRVTQTPLIFEVSNTSGHARVSQAALIFEINPLTGTGNCPTQLVGGAFQDPLGNPIANGFLRMQLTKDTLTCTANGQLINGKKLKVPLDQNGNIAGTVSVEANDLLTPAGSQYRVQLYDRFGTQVWADPHYWTILSFASVNVGTLVPH